MRIARLRLSNWMCFPDADLVLEGKPYAVVARRSDNAERSNWCGKTALFEAIRFALYGSHRFRTDEEWITRDAGSGSVEIVLDDGTTIRRTKARNKPAQLFLLAPGAAVGPTKDEAQRAIEQLVGLNERDFEATCYFEQRQMARLILAKPEPRTEIVSSWLRLDPLRACEADVSRELRAVLDEMDSIQKRIAINAGVADTFSNASLEELDKARPPIEELLQKKIKLQREAVEAHARAEAIVKDQDDAEKHAAVLVEGREVKAKIRALDEGALRDRVVETGNKLGKARATLQIAKEEVQKRRVIASGSFDGACPVVPMECPAKQKINAMRTEAAAALEEARGKLTAASDAATVATEEDETAAAELAAYERLTQRMEHLRVREKELRAAAQAVARIGEDVDLHALRAKVDRATEDVAEVRTTLKMLDEKVSAIEKALKANADLSNQLDALNKRASTLREALIIFGRNGAQRRLAESALAEIQTGANEALASCGIDLRISLLWSREGKGFAEACEACGHPYPSSVKVKECGRCGAPRGAKTINRLEVELSDRSGAAEDLAGGALQLAASAWLRADRGAGWGVAMLDEPFGTLDASHRRTFGAHLATMLSGRYGFAQSFVIAHHSSALDSLPGRIEVVSDGRTSTARVVA